MSGNKNFPRKKNPFIVCPSQILFQHPIYIQSGEALTGTQTPSNNIRIMIDRMLNNVSLDSIPRV
jgi:hypothetical protein